MSARSDWRYIAQRLNGDGTATFLDFDVPLMDVEIEDVLSGPNGLSGTISPELARLKGSDGLPLFEEWSTAIYAENGGEIRGGGILTHSGFEGKSWGLECSGFIGYAKEMPYTGGGANWVQTDTLDIFRAIWDHIQGEPGGDIGLEFSSAKSGVLVGSELASEDYDPEGGSGGLTLQSQAYKLAYYADHNLESNLNDLAEQSPFDYVESHYWVGEEIAHKIDFGVPTVGRRRDDLRFVIGENVFVKPQIDRAGEDYADEVYALGAGEGAKMIRGRATRPRRRLRRVAVISNSSMRRVSQANAAAEREVAWRMNLDDLSSIVVRDTPHAPVGSFNVGDEIYLEGETGWIEVGGWFRILTRSIKPGEPGIMELSLARTDRLA